MRFAGLAAATPEQRQAIGRCEICGEQAVSVFRDTYTTVPFGNDLCEIEAGKTHRLCEKHDREPGNATLYEGPLGFAARKGKP